MSNLRPTAGGRPPMLPTLPTGQTIARYGTYAEAQRAVDFLSDNAFPVQFVTIVGTDLRMVERVTGRLTYGRVALGGAASGAYFGLFVGILLLLFSGGADFSLLVAVLIGAGFGMLFGISSYAFTRGRRDFTSQSQIVASEYQVLCHEEKMREAIEVLGLLVAQGGPRGLALNAPRPTVSPAAGPPTSPVPGGVRDLPPPGAARPADSTPVPIGPTYGEMIAKQRRERTEREERERTEREERERTEREESPPSQPPPSQPPQDG